MKIRKVILFVSIIIGVILVLILRYYLGKIDISQQSIYEINWDINIPSDFNVIYHYKDKHGFQGDGKRYTIFKTEKIYKSPLITLKKDSGEMVTYDGNSDNVRNYAMEEFILTITTDLNIPENNIPQFDRYYIWQKFVQRGNTLIVLYLPSEHRIYFIEELF